ncbi:hypothetical protein K1T71_002925 [Dendrolimus kikuchii]|uniref:Uncharacterized protein n=1 Tax=Dendrolimus kikuchii TaxID=765133 RepID=A0ACC1DAF3_9NEOP|nr:hypothetical protein K1T71_002925 [Dendrolimus kikuchii]
MFYPIHRILRLCRSRSLLQNKRFNNVQTTTDVDKSKTNNKNRDFKTLLDEHKDKITFSSYIEHEKLDLGYFKYHLRNVKRAKVRQAKDYELKSLPPIPISLKYYLHKDRLLKEKENEPLPSKDENTFQLPFANAKNVNITENTDSNETPIYSIHIEEKNEYNRSDIDKWMLNYEHYDDSLLTQEDADPDVNDEWYNQYGTPDRNVGISKVACGGCGALLHCSDPAIPGYLPSEIFKGREDHELKLMECQRCHFLKEYNIALDINVQPEEYEKLLQSIRYVKSLVLLMVDLLDFPCSIWPGIVDIIGTDRPIIIVANKVDLLPGDSVGYLKRIRDCLMTEINKTPLSDANIKHVSLISAKTGYGVEELISNMFKLWLYKGDVYLIGCTNVGKSSLFNALLQSDYCKVHAVDLVKRATVSRWPGTTLNLLKFPINRPSGWKIYERTRRLRSEGKIIKIEKQIRKSQLQGSTPKEAPALIGHIGRTFANFHDINNIANERGRNMTVLNEKDPLFAKSKWFYDTPGVIHPDQVLSLLSTEELLLTIPKKLIRPQTYYLAKGASLFIGGLARIDFLDCAEACRFTIFCSECLPITVAKTVDADMLYETFLGTELFAVPIGGEERLKNWPGLAAKDDILEYNGEGPKICCGDVVLSSIAWVSVTAKGNSVCKLRAWTPKARGIYKRYPSLLPYSINLKGKRVRDTPAYMVGNIFAGEE